MSVLKYGSAGKSTQMNLCKLSDNFKLIYGLADAGAKPVARVKRLTPEGFSLHACSAEP
jgi:hypothetical protein